MNLNTTTDARCNGYTQPAIGHLHLETHDDTKHAEE